jgi:neutral ceramidase
MLGGSRDAPTSYSTRLFRLRFGDGSRKLAGMRLLRSWMVWVLLGGLLAGSLLAADQGGWKAGTARAIITPTEPLWMAGYASRTKPADGKVTELWLKALALEDARGHRAVIISADLLGFPQSIRQHTCAALKEKFALEPDQILLAASHTHSGPVLRGALLDIYPLEQNQIAMIERYTADLETRIVETVSKAIADLAPVRLAAGQGTAGFAVNRRNNHELEVPNLIREGALKGPVDHSVPVLAVHLPDGRLKAILFGYACHNTEMDFYKWCGDYAGYAQLALEKSHPETTALFFMGCGADQNPQPRRKLEYAERHGNMLAAAVEEVLLAPPRPLDPELRTTMEMVPLRLGPPPSETDLERLSLTSVYVPFVRRWAIRQLADLKAGKATIRTYPFPVQAWQFGGQQILITLGGEPVVDWALKFKQEFGPQTWVAGYCNDVMNYIPTLNILKKDVFAGGPGQGGYEGALATIVYGMPAFCWADDVEDLVNEGAKRVVAQLQAPAK